MKNLILIATTLLVVSCRSHVTVQHMSCCAKDAAPATTKITGQVSDRSVFQLSGTWTNQRNQSVTLSQFKGKVQIVAMIFTHCGYACPRIVEDMKAIRDSLPPNEQANVGFLLVSFDAQRDNPGQLTHFATDHMLDDRWTLLHGDPDQIRELSMVLNVRYQQAGDGNFSHTNAIFILDQDGRVIQTLEGLEQQTSVAISTINDLVKR